ncbi:MAG: hypothetical protein ABEK29_02750, partial [Bradymonadaceae bacterium]
MRTIIPTVAAIAAVLASVLTTGCDDCGDPTPPIPETPDARLETYASTLPATTESAFFVADIPALTDGASSLKARVGEFLPGTKFAARYTKSLVGVDLFARRGWSDAGIDDDGGAAVALVDGHPAILAHVTDCRAFERRLERLAERHYDITGSVRLESGGDLRMKVVHRSGAQIAWTYRDRMAIVVFPRLPRAPGGGPTVTNALRDLALDDGSTPLAETDAYRGLRADADHGPNVAYLRPQTVTSYLVGDGGFRAAALGTVVNLVLRPVTGAGAAIAATDDPMRGSIWIGTDRDLTKTIDQVAAVDPSGFGRDLVTPDTVLAARAALDPELAWRHGLAALPEATSRGIRRRLKRFRDRTDLAPVDDLLAPATGRLAVALENVNHNFTLPAFAADPLGELA